MNCPRCAEASLTEVDRDGITIDRCERCRGIWLDRGELEKLIARNKGSDNDGRDRDDRREYRRDDDDDDDRDHRRGERRRSSWWEIFD